MFSTLRPALPDLLGAGRRSGRGGDDRRDRLGGHYAKVVSKLVDRGVPTDEVAADLADLDVEIVPLDRDLAIIAERLRARTRSAGLSLGDRCCLALAGRPNAPAVTTDRIWESLGDALGIAIVMVR